jgi:hypothetical protein
MRATIGSFAAAAAVIGTATASANAQQAVQWRVEDGGNEHWYALRVPTGKSLSWEDARDAATASGGHLATITSEGENNFALTSAQSLNGWWVLNSSPPYCVGPWLGGFQPPGSPEPAGGWRWVTDEPWGWTNWWAQASEPNNGCGGGEDYLHWLSQGSPAPSGSWNDVAFTDICGIPSPKSYLIEWSADCNNDGIVDYGQCRDGSLPDYNGNNIPDCCEAGTTCVVGDYPIQWRVEDGGNGHWYQGFSFDEFGISWSEARQVAIQRGADLAALDSVETAGWVWDRIVSDERLWSTLFGPWIGAYQPTGSVEPQEGWIWVNGAPVDNSVHWGAGQPDNSTSCGGAEHYMNFFTDYQAGPQNLVNDSADVPVVFCQGGSLGAVRSAVVEWSADCNNDGIVDYGQILQGQLADVDGNGIPDTCESPDCNSDGVADAEQVARGELADFDGSGVPDCCESGEACVVGYYPVQWRVEDGGNGHWYMAGQTQVSWPVARDSAQAMGGHLVTVTSAEELSFVNALATVPYPGRGVWSGGLQVPAPAGSEPCAGSDCHWAWVTGEPWDFTAWDIDEPNDEGGKESRLEIRWTDAKLWNDEGPATTTYWIAEWSTDCNGDGQVDYGQILRGELADSNDDGIPDVCSRVPQDFPSVQAAIDAAPASGLHGIIVAPGTYVEALDLSGKGVRIIGAGPAFTSIEAPVGLKASVVRATGEPQGALIQGVRIRGGQTGTTLPGAEFVRVGGGIFADQSALALRYSSVEGNEGGFGGGAYYRRCTGSILGCAFRANEAGADGGGMQISAGSMSVQDTVVEGNHANSRAGGIHVTGGIHTLRGVDIRSNSSGNIVGGLSFVWLSSFDPPTASLSVEDCSVTGNTALVSEGGIGILDATPADVQVSISGTEVCGNLPVPNVSGGPWTDAGGNSICDCATDVNLDGRTDGIDLATLLSQWGPATASTTCDFNASGAVDASDLSFMLAAWGNCGE